ncbi:SDR family NAD(P)-dependent oxidoreductase [Ascoidea rubescens DSM 1968]|uniref:NAD(P)-binding protein n=1 Tax=Ascoidea rubescens DSM 1968 TaxID=1344418 RepID=A0A1D2VBV2_9ASCO|nr:NAD(P)-binding protein [Ascoidea rubescens DSM 1968]ODV59168.1 NAD(P)-binding protein [Ascoidea rubescens DSM 1968]
MIDFNVHGKTCIITGGTRGLGYACAEVLLTNGAKKIFITSRNEQAVRAAVHELEKLGDVYNKDCEIIGIPSDLSKLQSIDELYNVITDTFKETQVDVLIANAGATWGAPLGEHPSEAIEKVLNLNLKGVFLTIQKFLPLLKKKPEDDPSRILIMGSIAGIAVNQFANTYGYLASKAGVIHLGKNLAIELAPKYNINVNMLAPGFFPSRMANGLLEEIGDTYVQQNPRKRLGKKEDLESVVLFLCSKQSNYINGAVIPIDGGHHLLGPAASYPSKL